MTVVVKVGGAVAARSAEAVLELAKADDVCVVHGAGPQISLEMERAGIAVEFVGGRRVTTAEGLEVVRRSFAAVNDADLVDPGELEHRVCGAARDGSPDLDHDAGHVR